MKTNLTIILLLALASLFAFTTEEKIDMMITLQDHQFSSTRLEDEWTTRLDNKRGEDSANSHSNAKSLLEIRYSDDKDFAKALKKEYTTQINYSRACFDYRKAMLKLQLERETFNSRQVDTLSFHKLSWLEERNSIAISIEGFNNIYSVHCDLYLNSFIDEYPEQCYIVVSKEYEGYDKWNYFNWELKYGDYSQAFSVQRDKKSNFAQAIEAVPENPFHNDVWQYEHVVYDTAGFPKEFSASDSLLADYGKKYLVVAIGVSDYEFLPSYKYAEEGAKAFKEKIQKMLFIPDENFYTSYDSQFKGFEHLDKFWFDIHAKQDSLKLILYYAGNGLSIDGKPSLLEPGFNIHLPQSSATTVDSLLNICAKYNFRSINLFLETNFVSLNNESMFITNDLDNLPPLMGMAPFARNTSIFFAGNTRGKTNILTDERQNLFTWSLLNSMNPKADRNHDKYITLSELQSRITLLSDNREEKLRIRQNPSLQTLNGNYILFRLDNPYK